MEVHNAQVHDDSNRFRDSNVDWRKQIEEEVRRQIWPNNQSADARKISNVENVETLNLPDVPDDDIVKRHTALPAKATNSEIEERLNSLKHGDAGDVNDKVKTKDFDKIMQFKTPRSP